MHGAQEVMCIAGRFLFFAVKCQVERAVIKNPDDKYQDMQKNVFSRIGVNIWQRLIRGLLSLGEHLQTAQRNSSPESFQSKWAKMFTRFFITIKAVSRSRIAHKVC